MKLWRVAIATCALALGAPLVFAQDRLGSPHEEKFRLRAGVFSADTDTDMRLDADDGTLGTEVSAEEDLGLADHSDVGDVEVELRIREKHRVRFNYFKIERAATEVLDRTIRFGNDVYNAGDEVLSSIDMRNFALTYSYEALRFDRYELGVALGVNIVELNAQARVPARGIREEESRAGPTPTVGIHTLVRITERIHAEARADYMQLQVDDFEGTVTNLYGAVVYRFNRNIGVGLGYMLLDTEVESNDPGDTGRFNISNSGGLLFVRVTF